MTRKNRLSVRMAVLSLTLLLTTNLMAQELQPFVYAGLGVSEYVHQGSGEASWKLGGGTDWQFHKHWGVRPMLELTRKGADELLLSNYREHTWYTRMYYVEMPVVAYYTGRLSKAWTIQAGAGPYAAYGLWGKMHIFHGDESYHVFGSEMDFKRFDYGYQLMAQVRKNHWAFSFTAERGFVKLTDKFYKASPYNRVFHINAMYYF